MNDFSKDDHHRFQKSIFVLLSTGFVLGVFFDLIDTLDIFDIFYAALCGFFAVLTRASNEEKPKLRPMWLYFITGPMLTVIGFGFWFLLSQELHKYFQIGL